MAFNIGGGDKTNNSTNYHGGSVNVGAGSNINGDVNNIQLIIGQNGGGDGAKSVQGSEEGGGGFNPLDPLGLFSGLGGSFGSGAGACGLVGTVMKCLSV